MPISNATTMNFISKFEGSSILKSCAFMILSLNGLMGIGVGEWKIDPRTGKQYIDMKAFLRPDDKNPCSGMGAIFPEPKDEGENNFIGNLGVESSIKLGMYYNANKGEWRWNSSDSKVVWSNWFYQPQSPITLGCVIMEILTYTWQRLPCDSAYLGMIVCEKECRNRTFGLNCTKMCHCQNKTEVCHIGNGSCVSGCMAGWIGSDCQQECEKFKFGPGCELDCHCKDEFCDKECGFCKNGCADGWEGDDCQKVVEATTTAAEITEVNTAEPTGQGGNPEERSTGDGSVEGIIRLADGHVEDDNTSEWFDYRNFWLWLLLFLILFILAAIIYCCYTHCSTVGCFVCYCVCCTGKQKEGENKRYSFFDTPRETSTPAEDAPTGEFELSFI